jgi:hypothetical protein
MISNCKSGKEKVRPLGCALVHQAQAEFKERRKNTPPKELEVP